MSCHRTIIRLSAVLASLALGWACGGDSATAPEPARPTTVTVSPATHELTALGQTIQVGAEVRDQNARVMAGATVTWTSSANSVATVNASGLVTAAGNGTATITASAGEASGSAVVTVMQSVASVVVSPPTAELTALGETVQLTAEAFDENGHAVAGAQFLWESSDVAVATVDALGLVTAVAEGVARITASAGEASGSAVVPVMQPVASVEVSPSAETIGLGSTLQLTAAGFDENGDAVEGAKFSWESSDVAIATVDASGLVTGVAEGVATITASAGSGQGTAEITVMDLMDPDRAALVALYEATDGPNWANNENWLTDAPLGEWYGVELDVFGRVVSIELPDNRLRGVIPREAGQLSSLTHLDLNSNTISDLSGLSELTQLESLQLFENAVGDITPLSNLTRMKSLRLERNSVANFTPLAGLTNLETLSIGNTPIADLAPLAGLTNLRKLHIGVDFGQGKVSDFAPLAGLTNLEELSAIGHQAVTDLTPLTGLTKLRRLALTSPVPDISPLAGLIDMRSLFLVGMGISDISPLADMKQIWNLELEGNHISDISPVAGMTGLNWLHLTGSEVSDVSPLMDFPALRGVYLEANNISDLAPLAENTGLGRGDEVRVQRNPLSVASLNTHVPTLQSRGVEVTFSHIAIGPGSSPQLYNDNVFVLPVSEDLATDDLPLQEYAAQFYAHFEDEFDLLIFISNLYSGEDRHGYFGRHTHVRNDVQGIGLSVFSDGSWGSAAKLQSVIHFTFDVALSNGPAIHEVTHRWANFIVPAYAPHWGFTSANGQLGGFDIANLVDHGEGRYTAGQFTFAGFAHNIEPLSPIELYLAGFIPPEEVPDLWVAEDGRALRNEAGGIVIADNGFPMFTADRVRTYKIEDIIAEHGPRIPDHSAAQREFRAATVFLVNEDDHVYEDVITDVSVHGVSWFSHPGGDQYPQTYNFYEATGGRATITMGGLSQYLRKGNAVTATPGSYGTPPRSVVDYWESNMDRKGLDWTRRVRPKRAAGSRPERENRNR